VKITVVGCGFYGSTLVQRIAEADYADEVVMTDIIDGKPQGLALDMMQSRSIEGFDTRIVGTNGYDETAGSEVCVITAGLPRKPGMSRMDLLEVNAKIVGDVTDKLVAGSPDAVIIVVSNPLDEMTALCAKVARLPKARVIGQAGMLDTARFKHFVAERIGTTPSQVEELVQRTRDGGAEIVSYLKTGSAYYAPSSAAEAMVEAVVRDSGELMPVCAWVEGQYGVRDVYLGVPARIGAGGVKEIVELPLADDELAALRAAADAVRAKQSDVDKLV